MKRRRWLATDPEPGDRPYLVDDLGHPWLYDSEGDDETGVWPGWFSPLVSTDPCSWSDIFTHYQVEYLSEITELELQQLEADLLGWHAHYPGHEDPPPLPEYCTRCMNEGQVGYPPAPCPKCAVTP